ncbi:MAG TPA: iron-containing alcohol dehydrogenase, partial [Clostridia bacterium]|nr:iron-containing alcohol dehydrogenase [Clostridia bacterium]
MSTRFEFATATRIVFGAGTFQQIGSIAKEFGRHALIVTGQTTSRAESLSALLSPVGIKSTIFPVAGEPEVSTVEKGVTAARESGCDMVISLGGGSALDAGKAIAAMLANPGELLDYLEVIG